MSVPQTLDDSGREWNRAGALEEIENLKNIRGTAWDEHTHSFRWIMATLSAINGGGCLAILNSDQIEISHKITSSGLFVGGVLMALLVAVFGQHSVRKSLVPLQQQIGYWMTVSRDGERDDAIEKELADDLRKCVRIGIAGRVSGWLAAVAFVSGVIVAGNGLIQNHNITQSKQVEAKETSKSND